MWSHLAVLCCVGGGGDSGLWEVVAFAAARRALFSSSFASLPPPQAALLAQASALCRLSGQLHVHRPLFQACLPALPGRSPQAGALAAGNHYCQQEGPSVPRGPGRPSFPPVGPLSQPLTCSLLTSPSSPEWTDGSSFFFLQLCFLVVF